MGSLMAGWDSPVPDPKSLTYQRNWSFTKGEIEAYWRLKKKIEEEHLKAIPSLSDHSKEDTSGSYNLQRSSSLPLANTKEGFMSLDLDSETNLEELIKKNGWWTRSNSAFLNEPPVFEGNSNSYASQFHIADPSKSKPNANNTGIST